MIDGNTYSLAKHHDRPTPIGNEDGEDCNRVHEPDEDQPRTYRPKPCDGVMNLDERDGMICCDTCGEIGVTP